VDSTLWSAIIGGAASVTVFVAGGAANAMKDRAANQEAARREARRAVEELVAAALEVQAVLAVMEAGRRNYQAIGSVIGRSMMQFMAAAKDGRPLHGASQGVSSAMEWRQATDASEQARILAAFDRMASSAAKAALLDDPGLRAASGAVTDALGKLSAAWPSRPASAARREAETALADALGELGDATRNYTGRPPRRRLGRRSR
jgi:hypothetical protein